MAYNVWGSYNQRGETSSRSEVVATFAFTSKVREAVDINYSFTSTIESNEEAQFDFSIPARSVLLTFAGSRVII